MAVSQTPGSQKSAKTKSAKKTTKAATTKSIQTAAAIDRNDPIAMLKADHRKVEGLFQQFEAATDSETKRQLADEVCDELIVHAALEEDIFYRECRDQGVDEEKLNMAQVEHDSAKLLIREIMYGSPEDDEFFDAKVKVLKDEVLHHIQEEEKKDGILALAKKAGFDMAEIASRMTELKEDLKADADERGLAAPAPRSFTRHGGDSATQKETNMPRYQGREEGRFTSGRGYGRYEEDEGYRGRYARGRYDDEDEYRVRGRYAPRSRYEEEDEGRGYGRGGWFGDPEGHSEAARLGWQRGHEGQRSGRSRYYGEDEDYRSRGRYARSRYEDENGGNRGRGGWFGDPEGHSEAARLGWERGHEGQRGGRYRYRD
jgi:hypothetical protein